MELTTMTLRVLHHDTSEMHRLIACLASILSDVCQRDPHAGATREQTSIKALPSPDAAATMALWRRTLVARHFDLTLPEVEAYRCTLNHEHAGVGRGGRGGRGGRATEETPALHSRGGPTPEVMLGSAAMHLLRHRWGKRASSGAN